MSLDVTHDHIVLVVDDEEQIGSAVTRILRRRHIPFEFVTDGTQALLKIREADTPYAVVISDERMPGMKGHELLAEVARNAPETIRFLMSAYTDLEAVIDAVNLGAINRFIPKPFDNDEFLRAVEKGIEQFELAFENRRLFQLAKTQNQQLLELYERLKSETEVDEKSMGALAREIEDTERKIAEIRDPETAYAKALEQIEQEMKRKGILNQASFEAVVAFVKHEFYAQFRDIAVRNGLTMPENDQWQR